MENQVVDPNNFTNCVLKPKCNESEKYDVSTNNCTNCPTNNVQSPTNETICVQMTLCNGT